MEFVGISDQVVDSAIVALLARCACKAGFEQTRWIGCFHQDGEVPRPFSSEGPGADSFAAKSYELPNRTSPRC